MNNFAFPFFFISLMFFLFLVYSLRIALFPQTKIEMVKTKRIRNKYKPKNKEDYGLDILYTIVDLFFSFLFASLLTYIVYPKEFIAEIQRAP